MTLLASLVGAIAAVLAAIGIYGVMSFSAARRTREIAVRMALGAQRGSVTWMVLREVSLLALAGIVLALPAAWFLMEMVQSQLFGVAPHDAATLAGAAAMVAVAAGYLPVRFAAGVDPMSALRME